MTGQELLFLLQALPQEALELEVGFMDRYSSSHSFRAIQVNTEVVFRGEDFGSPNWLELVEE